MAVNMFKTFYSKIQERQNHLPPSIDSSRAVKNTANSGVWSIINTLATGGISFIGTMFLARLLTPKDFGTVSISFLFTYFVMIFANFGITIAIIHFKDLSKIDLSTGWISNLVIDGIAGLICLMSAPFIASYFGDPRVQYIVFAIVANIMLQALGSIHLALMKKQFMFKQITIVAVTTGIFQAVISIILVKYFGFGVYGLAVSMIAGETLGLILKFIILPWLPSWQFSHESFMRQIHYGKWLLGGSVLNYANQTMDQFTTGRFLSVQQLGYYSFAGSVPELIVSKFIFSLNSVSFVTLSSLKVDGQEAIEFVESLIRNVTILTFPAFIGLAIISDEFVKVVYGDQWLGIITTMKIICLGGLFRVIAAILPTISNALGKPRIGFISNLISFPINLAALYYFSKSFGIEGVAIAMILGSVLVIIMVGIPIMKMLELSLSFMFKAIIPSIVCSGLMGAFLFPVVYYLREYKILPPALHLFFTVLLGAFIYVAVLKIVYEPLFEKYFEFVKILASRMRVKRELKLS